MEKKKMKLRTKIICFILFLLLLLLLWTSIKMMILANLQDKISAYTSSTNFHRIIYAYQEDTYKKTEAYRLGDKKLVVMTKFVNGDKTVTKIYNEGTKRNSYYIDAEGKKVAHLNQKGETSINPSTLIYTENLGQLFALAFTTSIKSEKCNGKDCYYIKSYIDSILPREGAYYDKQTGLTVRANSFEVVGDNGNITNSIVDYRYEFDTVTEKDMQEPDISQYEVLSK